jgi:hypothetical protein
LARTFSGITKNYLGNLLIPFKAKQIVSSALTELTGEEVEKIEKKVESFLMNKLNDYQSATAYLDLESEKGGVGLDKRKAEAITAKVKDLVEEIKLLESEDKKIEEGQMTRSGEASEMRQYLLDEFKIDLPSLSSLDIFDRALQSRLENKIDREELKNILDRPVKEGGVGLDRRTCRKIARRAELLILGKFK